MFIVSCQQMREIEKSAMSIGILSSRLMENAGSAATRIIRKTVDVQNKKCVIICGNGNNGGDGYVIARKLIEFGALVKVIKANGEPRTEETQDMQDRVRAQGNIIIDMYNINDCKKEIRAADIIVDAIYGTGFHGDIDDDLTREIIEEVNNSEAKVFAVDMPSGCNADTGEASLVSIRADYTVTFANPKIGQFAFPASDYCGKVITVDIGIPASIYNNSSSLCELLDGKTIKSLIPKRKKDSNKGNYGKVLVIAGSLGMAGAVELAVKGALRCGAGLVEVIVPKDIYNPVATKITEGMVYPVSSTIDGTIAYSNIDLILKKAETASVVLIGCGLSRNEETAILIRELVTKIKTPIVLDADGINAFEGHINLLRTTQNSLILTPHPGEMSRIVNKTIPEIQSSRLKTAKEFATENHVTLVLKGANTVIATSDGMSYINPTGNPGMAKGGSGDVLAGMTAAFIAQGIDKKSSCCLSTYIHGAAGDLAAEKLSQYSMLATDILDKIPQIFLEYSR